MDGQAALKQVHQGKGVERSPPTLNNVRPLSHLLPSITHLPPADSQFSNLSKRLHSPSDLSSSTAPPTRVVRTGKCRRYCTMHSYGSKHETLMNYDGSRPHG